MSNWIDVKDGPPKSTDSVLASEWYGGENYGMIKAYYNKGWWFIDKDCIDIRGNAIVDIGFEVTHWQPLPEPPQ